MLSPPFATHDFADILMLLFLGNTESKDRSMVDKKSFRVFVIFIPPCCSCLFLFLVSMSSCMVLFPSPVTCGDVPPSTATNFPQITVPR